MSKLNVVRDADIFQHLHLSDEADATIDTRPDVDFVILIGDTTAHAHALFHGNLVQLAIVVYLFHTLWARLPFEVHKWRDVVGKALVILDVAEDVEQLLVIILRVLDLLGCVVLQVAVSATLARFVRLIFLSAHCHDVFNALIDDFALDALDAQNKFHELAEFFLGVGEDVLEAEEVDGLVSVLGHVDPVSEPLVVPVHAQALELLPVAQQGLLCDFILKRGRMALSVHKLEEGRVSVKLVAGADDSDVAAPLPLEGQSVREVSLVDPSAIIGDTLGLESTELECHVGGMLDYHVAASGRSRHVLEVLAHETVAAAGVRRVHHLCLFCAVPGRVASMRPEEQLFFALVSIQVRRTHQSK